MFSYDLAAFCHRLQSLMSCIGVQEEVRQNCKTLLFLSLFLFHFIWHYIFHHLCSLTFTVSANTGKVNEGKDVFLLSIY